MGEPKPVAADLFAETNAGPRLTGSKCATCGAAYLPRVAVCHNPDCGGSRIEDAEYGPSGAIWSLAIQDYPPPAPVKFDEPYAPYAMAFVDLDDGLRVLGRIDTKDPHGVAPGTRVELVLDALAHDDEGNEIIGWKFRPV